MKRLLLVLLAACGHRAAPAAPPPEDAAPGCTQERFPDSIPIAEASGAVVTTLDGRAAMLVIADSGNHGAYLAIDPTSGDEIEAGALPLGDGASDDLEGLAQDGDDFLALTSSGWMRRWRRDGHGFTLADGPYPIGKVDPSLRDNPPAGGLFEAPTDALACAGPAVNCGKNYEALCLVPTARRLEGGCVGWAGSKLDGALMCLVADGARLTIDPARTISVAHSGALSDCAVDDTGTIWILTNAFDGAVYRVRPGAAVEDVPMPSWGFPEALAVSAAGAGSPRGREPERSSAGATPAPAADDEVWRFTDSGGTPSPAQRWRCLIRSR